MIKGSVEPVNMAITEKILNQMKNCVCKIKIKKLNATGFFCKIPDINMNYLMTNYHVINEDFINENKEINVLLNDNKEALKIDLTIKREKYFNKEYDISLIEIKDKDKIKDYLELDDDILKDNEKIYYEEKSIYILHYLLGKNICVSYGILNRLNNYDIIHSCSTDNGSSGSPILNLENNKVIGIHKQGSTYFDYNKGTLLKYPLNDIIKKYSKNYPNKNNNIINENTNNNIINEDKNNIIINENTNNIIINENTNNIIIGEINISKDDINKDIQIINSFENYKRNKPKLKVENEDKYMNEKEINENIEIKINEKKIKFTYKYKFKKEGKYTIEYLFKKNLTKTCYLFCECNLSVNLNLSNFNTQNVTNMSWMFAYCNSLTNLNLSNFNTQNVTNMEGMFADCNSLTILNLSNFNTQKVTNMYGMFDYCNALTNLNLSNFSTQNVTNMNWMFYNCNSLTKKNIITKDNKILKEFENK